MRKPALWITSIVLGTILGLFLGCSTKPDDAKITSEVKARFSQDSGLSTKSLTVHASNGVVTLAGTVDNDTQRDAASQQAASVAGVRTVVNDLQVGAAAAQPSTTASAAASSGPLSSPSSSTSSPTVDAKPAPGKKSKARNSGKSGGAGNLAADADANQMTASNATPAATSDNTPPANPPADNAPEVQPTPPPPPAPRKLIIDQGTQVTVRLIDPIDSEKNQTGDTFHATLNAALSSDGEVAVPAGTELTGHLVSVKSAGKFAGQSEVVLQLDSIASGGQTYNLETDQYKKTGSSRGKNTAEKVGGGAILGGIIGAIAGGGKGAAIGSAAGAGVGGGVQAATKGQQIKLPSETMLNFTLQAPITVVQAPSPDANRPKLPDSQ